MWSMGAIEVRHGPNAVHWAIRMGGRNIYWEHPIIRNGLLTGQDGVHVTHGHGILIREETFSRATTVLRLGRSMQGIQCGDPMNPSRTFT